MATSTQIPLAEYLATSYRPDREYIDGEVVERNLGTWDHARLQTLLGVWLLRHEAEWGVMVASGWRAQVGLTRVRVPDLTVVLAGPQTPVLQQAPLLIIEILSPDDSYSATERKAQDYIQMGVHTIWMIDPSTKTAACASEPTGPPPTASKSPAPRSTSNFQPSSKLSPRAVLASPDSHYSGFAAGAAPAAFTGTFFPCSGS